jgi:hypothetical protein
MARPANVEMHHAALARRLRPLYAAMTNAEFDRMVTRIAEIEVYGPVAEPIAVDRWAMRQKPARSKKL